MKSTILSYSKPLAASKLSEVVASSSELRVKRIANDTFLIVSEANFGALAMVEKEHFRIEGRLEDQNKTTRISYEIKSNATYRTLMYVLPLMLLPTVGFAMIDDSARILSAFIYYVLICMIIIGILHRKERLLNTRGREAWTEILDALNNEKANETTSH